MIAMPLYNWNALPEEQLNPLVTRKAIHMKVEKSSPAENCRNRTLSIPCSRCSAAGDPVSAAFQAM